DFDFVDYCRGVSQMRWDSDRPSFQSSLSASNIFNGFWDNDTFLLQSLANFFVKLVEAWVIRFECTGVHFASGMDFRSAMYFKIFFRARSLIFLKFTRVIPKFSMIWSKPSLGVR